MPLDISFGVLSDISTGYMIQVSITSSEYERACRERPDVPHEVYDMSDDEIVVSLLRKGDEDAQAVTNAWLLAALGETPLIEPDTDTDMRILRACCHMEIVGAMSCPGIVKEHRAAYEALKASVPSGIVDNPGWMPLRDLWSSWASSPEHRCGFECASCGEKLESVLGVDCVDEILQRSVEDVRRCVGCALAKRKAATGKAKAAAVMSEV